MKPRISLILLTLVLISCDDEKDTSVKHVLSATTPVESTQDSILIAHNAYRSDVNIDDLTWSNELAASAKSWADQLANECAFYHSDSPFGENIWRGTSGFFNVYDVVNSWGSEIEDYNYDTNTCSDVCGHYTQIVWESTTKVGCAISTCNGNDIWVCQYDPPGNFVGEKPY